MVDFSKAFDSISFSFLNKTLKFYNFSPEIITWINILLYNFESVTCVNGNPSERIRLGRGCRQGDPIAGYLFILAIEILMLRIATDKNLSPWKSLEGRKHILDGYADDLSIFLSLQNIEFQLQNLHQIFLEFKTLSGLTTNVGKTKYVIIGNPPLHMFPSLNPFSLDTDPYFRLLGINLNPQLTNLDQNWLDALSDARKESFAWAKVDTTIFGRVNIARTSLLSKFTHIAAILPPP